MALNISEKIRHGVYLSGNRFSQSAKEFPGFWDDTPLPSYVSNSESGAPNLYISNDQQFVQYFLIVFCFSITELFLFFSLQDDLDNDDNDNENDENDESDEKNDTNANANKTEIKEKQEAFTKTGFFMQMQMSWTVLTHWSVLIVVLVLAMLYFNFANYYSKGYPLSSFSLAYFENPSLFATVVLLLVIFCTNLLLLVAFLKYKLAPAKYVRNIHKHTRTNLLDLYLGSSMDTTANGGRRHVECTHVLQWLLYLFGWLMTMAGVIVYFALESLPNNNTLHLSSTLLTVVQKSLAFLLSIHNSFIVPNLSLLSIHIISSCLSYVRCWQSQPSSSQQRHYSTFSYNFIILSLRSLTCIIVPLLIALAFYDNCARTWVDYWQLCQFSSSNGPSSIAIQANLVWDKTLFPVTQIKSKSLNLLYWGDICHKGFTHSFQYEKWCNVLLVKMIINIFTPWIEVLLCNSCCNTPPVILKVESASLISNLELTLLIGMFCPFIVPLCACCILSNYWKFKYLLNKYPQCRLSDADPPSLMVSLVCAYLLQQLAWILTVIFNHNMYYNHRVCWFLICFGFLAIHICGFLLAFVLVCRNNTHNIRVSVLVWISSNNLGDDVEIATRKPLRSTQHDDIETFYTKLG
ncbi:hypothetical protein RFI_10509 [Reticulomyxa filosa]|uniref:Uncharacterized protein n=1 Tax=Reticulomyxa filosa TaxID=46433 RepID=X6NMJ7_RETFI|nr:hypothetical protein RFI_10509 [Reticulomyxa filosa]|eukprot:ETO26627.1 hypothetical protein RFI_10509 [Reticulomyxa filosa]